MVPVSSDLLGRKDGAAHTAHGREHPAGTPPSGDGLPVVSWDLAARRDVWRRATGGCLRARTARECPLVSAREGDPKERNGSSRTGQRECCDRYPESRKRAWLGLFPLTKGTKC